MNTDNQPSEPVRSAPRPIRQFIVKTAVVVLAIIAVLSFLDNLVEQRVAQIQSAAKIGGREFWTGLERELERQADPRTDISPEKKQKIISEVRIVADRWRPLISDLQAAIGGGAAEKAK